MTLSETTALPMASRNPSLVLASQSPRRRQILEMLGFRFSTTSPPFEEIWPDGMETVEVPAYLARGKALSVLPTLFAADAVVLASDTVVVIDDQILGKPDNEAHALTMLRRLNGRTHVVYTGIALARGGAVVGFDVVGTEVDFALRSDAELQAYAKNSEPMDKAGAYAVQGLGAFLVAGIRGCFFNVMGLPVQATLKLLAEVGIEPGFDAG
jgi:septum formation protein